MLNDDTLNLPDRPKRHVPHLALEREAAAAVRPFAGMIGKWQGEAVQLAEMARRLRESGRYDPRVIESVRTSLIAAGHQRLAFETVVAGLSEGAARSGRVSDTRRGFAMVEARLTETLHKLGAG